MSRFTVLLCLVPSLLAVIALTSGSIISDFWKSPQIVSRIVGGNEINIRKTPWQVSLQLNFRKNIHLCGGSIISPTWILSAAHCAYSFRQFNDALTIRAGTSTHASGGQLVKVKRIIAHKQYDSVGSGYDVALLELQESLQFDETKQPIDLPDDSEDIADNALCMVTGWGDTQNNTESSSNLRAVLVPIVNHQKCSKLFKDLITPSMICAGYALGKKDACRGDSGGPLVCNKKLIGVVSWGNGCASPNQPGIYSRVQAVRSWIREISGI